MYVEIIRNCDPGIPNNEDVSDDGRMVMVMVMVNLWMHEGERELRGELSSKGTKVELHLHLV